MASRHSKMETDTRECIRKDGLMVKDDMTGMMVATTKDSSLRDTEKAKENLKRKMALSTKVLMLLS